ncbi:AAA family ATPase [Gemmatimonas sp.]|uniref:serine/threonine-protein kinase n=1 Tax=Gemmatimonas sp. TaxID=1962908 RepID=UPI0025BB25CC|nr:AAA family ATPase [Gemmatimonas sp.]MCA2989505.1 AAA family ATPase [Gemmatimonas sp.]
MLPGTTVDHFEITERLGAGGMGEVYRARDTRLGRELALKVLPMARVSDPEATERFLREARAASALNHPNVVTVYDIGRGERGLYIAMELVRGHTLATYREPLDVSTVARLGAQAAQALAVAHDARIVHRDIKPENLMLRDDGYLKVLDFGLARLFERSGPIEADASHTKTGVIMGTLRYLSPEQASGDPVAAPSDVFGLGVVLYELLAASHPFNPRGSSSAGTLGAIITRDPVPLQQLRPQLPVAMARLVHGMLAKEPADRPTAVDVALALGALTGTGLDSGGLTLAVRDTTGTLAATPPGGPTTIFAPTLPGTGSDAVATSAAAPRRGAGVGARTTVVVGRRTDRALFMDAWQRASSGRGSLLVVSGEPGVGKTTFVEACLAEIADSTGVVVARGRCSERLAGTEAFLPILEAIESAMRADPSGDIAALLRRHAPTWHREVGDSNPAHATGVDGAAPGLQAASPERMKRELLGFIDATARAHPLAIVLEDLHWADSATVDMLAYLGSRVDDLPLLVITTLRESEMRLSRHPFMASLLDLQARGLSESIALGLLDADDVQELLDRRYPGHRFPPTFARLLHHKTDGSPLFLVDLLRWLGSRGALADFAGAWQLTRGLPEVERDLPPSVRGMIQRKIEQLEESDRKLLTVASVQGFLFDSTVLADVLGMEQADVEERLTTLDKVYAFVRPVAEHDLPDSTLSVRYRFVHVLYQNALYHDLQGARRVQLATQVASALEARYGARATEVAADLAVLWETARHPAKSSGYFAVGAMRAGEKFAYTESAELASRGLAQIALLPDGEAKTTLEIGLRVSLGFTNVVTRGFHAPETFEQMHRAHELSKASGNAPQLIPVLWGMVVYHIASGQFIRAYEYAEQMIDIADAAGDVMLQSTASSALSGAAFFRGRLQLSRESQARAEALTTPAMRAGIQAIVGSDPLLLSRCQAGRAHWMAGDIAGARAIFDRMLADVRVSKDPRERAHGALHVAEFELAAERPDEALRVAAEALHVCEEYGVASERLWTAAYLGRAQIAVGELDAGIATLEATVGALTMFRCLASVSEYQGFLAEGYLEAGRVSDARQAVDEGLGNASSTGEIVWIPELHRIRAHVLHAEGAERSAVAAELHRALTAADQLGAQLIVQRVTRDLAALGD